MVVHFYSNVHSGYKDTRIPEPYGNPQPSDGILSSDEITLNGLNKLIKIDFILKRQLFK